MPRGSCTGRRPARFSTEPDGRRSATACSSATSTSSTPSSSWPPSATTSPTADDTRVLRRAAPTAPILPSGARPPAASSRTRTPGERGQATLGEGRLRDRSPDLRLRRNVPSARDDPTRPRRPILAHLGLPRDMPNLEPARAPPAGSLAERRGNLDTDPVPACDPCVDPPAWEEPTIDVRTSVSRFERGTSEERRTAAGLRPEEHSAAADGPRGTRARRWALQGLLIQQGQQQRVASAPGQPVQLP